MRAEDASVAGRLYTVYTLSVRSRRVPNHSPCLAIGKRVKPETNTEDHVGIETRATKFVAKWLCVALLSLATCELSLIVWDFAPKYRISIKGLPKESSDLWFTLSNTRLYKLIPQSAKGINSHGFRDVEFTPLDASKRRLVTVGDSFPMGLAVPPASTFPKRIPDFLSESVESLNLGIQGYGPDQELDVIRNEVLELKPQCVLWSIFPGNDFADIVKDGLYALRDDGVLEPSSENLITTRIPKYRLSMAMNLLRYGSFLHPDVERYLDSAFFQDKVTVLSDPEHPYRKFGVPLASSILSKGREELAARGIKVVALVIPSFEVIQDDSRLVKEGVAKSEYFTNEKLAVAALKDVGIPFVDLTPLFTQHSGDPLYVTEDRHLSALGHEEAAKAIAPLVRDCLK